MSNILMIAVPVAIAVIVLAILLLTGYVKASPDEAAVISGLSKQPRILIGKGGFKIPYFDRKEETTGVDMTEIVKANTYDAKVNRHVVIDGAVPVQKEETAAAAESDTDSEA